MEDVIVGSPRPLLATAQEPSRSAVSWAAILAGAAVAAATSLVLLILAAGLGFGALSPWSNSASSATKITVMAAVALIVIQWFSASLGGYLTGRLRLKWAGTHTHEVFFRDTAHGFVTWAVATLLVAGIVTAGATAFVGMGARAAATAAPAAAAAVASSTAPYEIQVMFRSTAGAEAKGTGAADAQGQAVSVLMRAMESGELPAADRTYLAQLVASQTGTSQTDAQARVDEALTQLKAADLKARTLADTARKDAEIASLLTALSLVIGAFIASVSAALGGRLRDLHP